MNCLVRSLDVYNIILSGNLFVARKLTELDYLEEVKVVTRFP